MDLQLCQVRELVVFGCVFLFGWLGCLFWLFYGLAPSPPSYISYESHKSQWNGHLTLFWDAVPLVLLV